MLCKLEVGWRHPVYTIRLMFHSMQYPIRLYALFISFTANTNRVKLWPTFSSLITKANNGSFSQAIHNETKAFMLRSPSAREKKWLFVWKTSVSFCSMTNYAWHFASTLKQMMDSIESFSSVIHLCISIDINAKSLLSMKPFCEAHKCAFLGRIVFRISTIKAISLW